LVVVPLGSLIYKAGAHVHATEAGFAREWSLGKAASITFGSPFDHAPEFQWSLLMALCTALLTLAVVVPLAYAAHSNQFAAIAATLLAVGALAVPGPLLSLGLISLVNDPAWPWLNYLYDRTIGVAVMAQTVRALPLTLFLVWCGLRTIPRANREAALLDGAGPCARLWLAVRQRPAAVALAGLAPAVISMGELSATILVAPPGIEPLAVRIFGLLHYNVEDQVAGITLTLIVLHSAAAVVILTAGRRAFRLG
jgi:iron(III) transport system permease protein